MKLTTEMRLHIHNDDTGAQIQIGEDSDGLGMIEIRQVESNAKDLVLHFSLPEVPRLIDALRTVHLFLTERERQEKATELNNEH